MAKKAATTPPTCAAAAGRQLRSHRTTHCRFKKMPNKMPDTPTLDASAAGRQLQSHAPPLRRSPRFQPLTIQEATLLSLPNPTSSKKQTKQPERSSSSAEKRIPDSCRNRRSLPHSVDNSASLSRRRSARLASAEAKNVSNKGGGAEGGRRKMISPDWKNSRTSKSVGAPQSLRRSSRLASIAVTHMIKGGVLDFGEEGKEADAADKEGQRKQRIEVEERLDERKGVAGGEAVHCCGSGDWTEEQENALRRAYLLSRPSPHFWKKVSKMVPGKSAEECFNKIHANLATPPEHEPRSRAKNTKFSPIGTFTFSDNSADDMKRKVKKARSCKQKSFLAQKTVRHLLKKHQLADQYQKADYFSVLENSPNALAPELPEIGSPGSPDSSFTPGFLFKCSEKSSSAHKKFLSRFKTKDKDPSPEVLKRIKNTALHEKYIDHLHCIEARRVRRKTANPVAATYHINNNKLESGDPKAARAALITEAKEAIGHFQHMQANALNYDNDDNSSDNLSADSDNDDDI
ncbi:hypothetical protein Cni_G04715 [Canna indica]|uniref:Myb-like domain-containing protein n=1 Tax=Canna indica TaxID=4628 RepID=A0AAQ3Q2Y8_9LILI|nr:hypothetical protein Cni_G04715 [Canna indica]